MDKCANCARDIEYGTYEIYRPDNVRGDRGHWDSFIGWHHIEGADGEDASVCREGTARDPGAEHAVFEPSLLAPGDGAVFVYSFGFDASSEICARLYDRTGQWVEVLRLDDPDDVLSEFPTFAERAEVGHPITYRVRFPDGHEDDALEDELIPGTTEGATA